MLTLPRTFGPLGGPVPSSYLDDDFTVVARLVISTISELRSVPKTAGAAALVLGANTAGDGGGGSYYYNANDTSSADNGGTIIVAADGGRWYLLHAVSAAPVVNAAAFGYLGTGAASQSTDTAALQAAINVAEGNTQGGSFGNSLGPVTLFIPAGIGLITAALIITRPLTVMGDGPAEYSKGTRLCQVTANTDLFTENPAASGISVSYLNIAFSSNAGAGTGNLVTQNWTGGSGYSNSNRFQNCVFANWQALSVQIVGDDTSFTNCTWDVGQNANSSAIGLGSNAGAGWIATNVRFTACNWFLCMTRVFLAWRYRNVTIDGCQVTQSGGFNTLYFFDAANTTPPAGQASGLTITNCGLEFVQCALALGVNCTGTVFAGNRGFSTTLSTTDWINDQSVDAIIVDNVLSAAFGAKSMYNDNGHTGTTKFSNNTALASSASGLPITVTGSGGTIRDNTYSGFAAACVGAKFPSAGAPFNPGTVGATAVVTQAYTVNGAAAGDKCILTPGGTTWPVAGTLNIQAFISAANTMTVRYVNASAAGVVVTAHDWLIEVYR